MPPRPPTPSSRNAVSGRGHLRAVIPPWDRRAPELRHFPETDRRRPQCRPRALVVRQCPRGAADGCTVALRRQHLGSFRHGAHRCGGRRALRHRHVHDRIRDRRRHAHARQRGVRHRHGREPASGRSSARSPGDARPRNARSRLACDGRWFVRQSRMCRSPRWLQYRLDNCHTTMLSSA